MYYTIQNNSILTADNEQALSRFYDNVLPLPNDYEKEKYIAQNGELVLNPDWKKVEANKRIIEILAELQEIDNKTVRALRANDTEYLEIYENQANELREELRSLQQ